MDPYDQFLLMMMMGGQDPFGYGGGGQFGFDQQPYYMPTFDQAQVENMYGLLPQDEDTLDFMRPQATHAKNMNSLMADSMTAAMGGLNAYSADALQPTVEWEPVDMTGLDTFNRHMESWQGGADTIDGYLAQSIAETGSYLPGLAVLQQAASGGDTPPEGMSISPEEWTRLRGLTNQIPLGSADTYNGGYSFDWRAVQDRGASLEEQFQQAPRAGGTMIDPATGEAIPGEIVETIDPQTGQVRLMRRIETPSPQAEWFRERGLPTPLEQFSLEDFYGGPMEEFLQANDQLDQMQAGLDAPIPEYVGPSQEQYDSVIQDMLRNDPSFRNMSESYASDELSNEMMASLGLGQPPEGRRASGEPGPGDYVDDQTLLSLGIHPRQANAGQYDQPIGPTPDDGYGTFAAMEYVPPGVGEDGTFQSGGMQTNYEQRSLGDQFWEQLAEAQMQSAATGGPVQGDATGLQALLADLFPGRVAGTGAGAGSQTQGDRPRENADDTGEWSPDMFAQYAGMDPQSAPQSTGSDHVDQWLETVRGQIGTGLEQPTERNDSGYVVMPGGMSYDQLNPRQQRAVDRRMSQVQEQVIGLGGPAAIRAFRELEEQGAEGIRRGRQNAYQTAKRDENARRAGNTQYVNAIRDLMLARGRGDTPLTVALQARRGTLQGQGMVSQGRRPG